MRILFLFFLVLFAASPAHATSVSMGVVESVIPIQMGFTGDHVILYGGMDRPRAMVALIQGPPEARTVYRKKRILGLWINADYVRFAKVPSYNWYAASPGLIKKDQAFLKGYQNIAYEVGQKSSPQLDEQTFLVALAQNRAERGLYGDKILPLQFVGDHLFRLEIPLPAYTKPGTYQVKLWILRGDKLIPQKPISFTIYQVAHEQKLVYACVSLALSIFLGWLAAKYFRRD